MISILPCGHGATRVLTVAPSIPTPREGGILCARCVRTPRISEQIGNLQWTKACPSCLTYKNLEQLTETKKN
jgi:hypothetical protein